MASIPNLIPIIGASVSIGGIIFQIDALEKKEEHYNDFMNDIHSKLLLADEKLKNIENDVKYIKSKIIK